MFMSITLYIACNSFNCTIIFGLLESYYIIESYKYLMNVCLEHIIYGKGSFVRKID